VDFTKDNLIEVIKIYETCDRLHRLTFQKLLEIFPNFWYWDEILDFLDYDAVCPQSYNQETYFELQNENDNGLSHIVIASDNDTIKKSFKKQLIGALIKTNYSQKRAAKLLGISARRVNYWIQKFKITHPNWKKNKVSNETENNIG